MHQPKRLLPNCQTKTAGQRTPCFGSLNLRQAKKGKGWASERGHSQEVANSALVGQKAIYLQFISVGGESQKGDSFTKMGFHKMGLLLLTHMFSDVNSSNS